MRILYTGFKGKNNTSSQLVASLDAPTLLLTNSFQGLQREVEALNDEYDAVVMIGTDKALTKSIRFDLRAENEGENFCSAYNIDPLIIKCNEMHIAYSVSIKPTQYLCNAAYWHMLQKNRNTIFMHIPSLKGMDAEFMCLLAEALKNNG